MMSKETSLMAAMITQEKVRGLIPLMKMYGAQVCNTNCSDRYSWELWSIISK